MKTNDLKYALDLFRRVIVQMVAHPEALVIESRKLTASVIVTIQAHAADTPRLIGEGAANYRALVAIVTAMGDRAGWRVTVPPIKEPTVGEPARYKFESQADWPQEKILALLREVLAAMFHHEDDIRTAVDEDAENAITTIEVFVSRQERADLVDLIGPALRRVFDAIGRANGRLLAVDVMRDSDPAQPETADGRNMKQVRR